MTAPKRAPTLDAPISAAEAARLLGKVDPRTVRGWIDAGLLRGERLGRRWWTTIASVRALRARLMPPRRSDVRA